MAKKSFQLPKKINWDRLRVQVLWGLFWAFILMGAWRYAEFFVNFVEKDKLSYFIGQFNTIPFIGVFIAGLLSVIFTPFAFILSQLIYGYIQITQLLPIAQDFDAAYLLRKMQIFRKAPKQEVNSGDDDVIQTTVSLYNTMVLRAFKAKTFERAFSYLLDIGVNVLAGELIAVFSLKPSFQSLLVAIPAILLFTVKIIGQELIYFQLLSQHVINKHQQETTGVKASEIE